MDEGLAFVNAIILIGGLGTRLRPLTYKTPKPLLPLADQPFVVYQFELLKKHGVRDITLCTAYMPEEFQNVLGDGSRWGVRLHYVHEKTPLGTGGALKNAQEHAKGTTLVFNGDILTDTDLTNLVRFHKEHGSRLTLGLTRVEDPSLYGLVETDSQGRIVRFQEKPPKGQAACDTVNAGLYVLEPEILDLIPAGVVHSLERELFPLLLERKTPLFACLSDAYWLDIGTIDKYEKANRDILNGALPLFRRAVP